MKRILLFLICLVAAVRISAQAFGLPADFSAVNVDGHTLYYHVIDAANHKVELTRTPTAFGLDGGYTINGKIDIPAEVEHDGVTYKVTRIGVAFMNKGGNASDIVLHEGLEEIAYLAFWQMELSGNELTIPSTVTRIENSFSQTYWTNTQPFTFRMLNPIPASGGGIGIRNPSYTHQFNRESLILEKIVVPVDATKDYMASTESGGAGSTWSELSEFYREELTIGPNGYTTYYLENENFEVPAGCTAYIITAVNPRPSETAPAPAVAKAFAAGSIIPKQTGFILQGTPNSTVVYRANVNGTEADVSGNLLMGRASAGELSGAGYKWYVFGNGSKGQGFYHQTGRGGNSIRLKAHKAGLRLPVSGVAPANAFIFDFEEAKRNLTTGISVVTEKISAESAGQPLYDLQGRRAVRPSKSGVYIQGGKKVIINTSK